MSTSERQVTLFAPGIRLVSSGKNQQIIVQDVDAGEQSSTASQQAAQAADATESIFQRGYAKGLAEGKSVGAKDGAAAANQAAATQIAAERRAVEAQYHGIAVQVPQAIQQYLAELETQMRNEVCSLAIGVAEAILHHELSQRDSIAEVIQETLRPLLNYQGVKLHLCPSDAAKVRQGDLSAQVQIVDDPGLAPGEAMLQSRQGFIDATVRGRLEAMRDCLQERLLNLETADAATAADQRLGSDPADN